MENANLRKTTRVGKRGALLLALLPAVLGMNLVGCPGCPTPVSPPRVEVPVRKVVDTRTVPVRVYDAGYIDVPITGSGSPTMDATADWTSASNNVDLYVTSTGCSNVEDLLVRLCSTLSQANSTTAKPEKLTMTVTAGSVHRIWVANFGPGAESVTVEVGLTP